MRKIGLSIMLIFSLVVICLTITVSATNYTTHIHDGSFSASAASNLKVNFSSDVSDYKSKIEDALDELTEISSNLGWSSTTDYYDRHIYLWSGNFPNDTAYATASYYCKTLGVFFPCSNASDRDYVQIKFNRYHMDSSSWDNDNRKKTIIHEVGHALSLGHVEANEGNSIMRQGKLKFTKPQSMDVDHIEYIWGD